MLVINDQEYFNEVLYFAKTTGRQDQLQQKLDYLDTYAEHGDKGATRCLLGKDFAPYSFGFIMQKRVASEEYDYWFNGGLILHGDHDNGGDGGAPTFSVCLGQINGWSIHT